jgi:hypothetical protein
MVSYDELKNELLNISKILHEFPDQIKTNVYNLLISQYIGTAAEPVSPEISQNITVVEKQKTADVTKAKKNQSGKESYSIDKNLNLRGDGTQPSFKDFHSTKKPSNYTEFNAIAIYYLQKILGLSTITLDHVYTCYLEVNEKPAKAFKQSFTDTKNKKGWIDIKADGTLEIPHRGVVFVDHDLPTK